MEGARVAVAHVARVGDLLTGLAVRMKAPRHAVALALAILHLFEPLAVFGVRLEDPALLARAVLAFDVFGAALVILHGATFEPAIVVSPLLGDGAAFVPNGEAAVELPAIIHLRARALPALVEGGLRSVRRAPEHARNFTACGRRAAREGGAIRARSLAGPPFDDRLVGGGLGSDCRCFSRRRGGAGRGRVTCTSGAHEDEKRSKGE